MEASKLREARVEVRLQDDVYTIRLLDLGGHGRLVCTPPIELASESLTLQALSDGWDDLTLDDRRITPEVLCEAFAKDDRLTERQTWGSYLARLLSPNGKIGQKWNELRFHCDANEEDLATLLDLPKAWQAMPWELIYDCGSHLSHHQRHTVGLRGSGSLLPCDARLWPLRILVVIGCDEDDQAIQWSQERDAIHHACCAFSLRVDLTVIGPGVGQREVERLINVVRPHVFHFIGHGTANNGGSLTVNGDRWKRDEIQRALTANRPPRLAIINACQSAGEQGALDTGSTADAFAQIGAAAVISMRGDIAGKGAATLSETFYREMSELGIDRIDKAFGRAIGAMVSEGDIDQRTWALPRIYFQDTVASVFPSMDQESRGFKHAAKHDPHLRDIQPFVNCLEQRSEIYQKSDSWLADSDPAHRVLLITGDENAGKTWLLKAFNYVATLRNLKTLFWRFNQYPNYDLHRFLEMLRDDRTTRSCFGGSLLEAGLNDDALNRFYQLCQAPDLGSMRGDEDASAELMSSLFWGLNETSKAQPLIMFFDQIERFDAGRWKDCVVDPLIRPVAMGNADGNLRAVIAAKESDLATYGLSDLSVLRLPLGEHPPEKFAQYAVDYLLLLMGEKLESELLESVKKHFDDAQGIRLQTNGSFQLNEVTAYVKGLGFAGT